MPDPIHLDPVASVPQEPDPDKPVPATQNWKLTLAYDGTDFSGWQIQPGERTVQGELQAALRRVCAEAPLPQGSGRTDAGVHALGQVASFELRAGIPPANLQLALNRTLPPSIRVLESKTMPSTFHARHSTLAKTYEYRVFRNPVCPPFLARYVHACSWPMNFDLLQRSALLFEGQHNFRSFAATDPDLAVRKAEARLAAQAEAGSPSPYPPPPPEKQGSIRVIYSSVWEQRSLDDGELLIYRVRGNGFLHHMVRNLVGTMLDVGRGYMEIDRIPKILKTGARAAAGPTAPAQGLYLHSVEYR